MPDWAHFAVSLVSVLVALTALASTRARASLIDGKDMLSRLVELETKVELIWKDVSFAASFAAARSLHEHDDRHELDDLIDKFMAELLELEEAPLFVARLQSVRRDGPTAHKRQAAEILLRQVRDRFGIEVE